MLGLCKLTQLNIEANALEDSVLAVLLGLLINNDITLELLRVKLTMLSTNALAHMKKCSRLVRVGKDFAFQHAAELGYDLIPLIVCFSRFSFTNVLSSFMKAKKLLR